MQVVEINESSRTYVGPWEWHAGSVVVPPYMLHEDAVAAGYEPAPIVEPVPLEVHAWKIAAVLEEEGNLVAMEEVIANYRGPNHAVIRARFKRGDMFPRDGEVVNAFGHAIGKTPEQVDELFRRADRIPD